MKFSQIMFLLALMGLLAGCVTPPAASTPGSPGGGSPGGAQKAFQSEKQRETPPPAAQTDIAELSAGNAAFALDLYHALDRPGENLFYSPYSISLALAMTYGGAQGATAEQMAGALHFTLPGERLHPAFNAVDQELASRSEIPGGEGADGKGFRLNVVNDLWGQHDLSFQPAFLDLLAQNYGAGLRPMDFKNNHEAARKEINNYIAEKTEQRIKDLLAEGVLNPMTRLVLTNAIYFNAAWLKPFEESLTEDAPFTLLDGSQVSVPMMRRGRSERLNYADGDGYQAVALPYENAQLAMLLLVPDEGQFEAFEDGLDAARLESIRAEMSFTLVEVSMPRFKVESAFQLKDALTALGMQDAFIPEAADFSGMTGQRDLFISDVVHKSFVSVDEAGTEAAAATAVVMETTAMIIDEPVQLTIDRPFIFMIIDQPTGTLLFTGRVVNPQP